MNHAFPVLPPAPGESHNTALVLGGGGSAGNAWLIGVVAGLAEAGLDITDADLIIGTSAGATAAAQITTADPRSLFRDVTTPSAPPSPRAARPRPVLGRDHLASYRRTIASSADAADLRRRMAASVHADASTGAPTSDQWRATVAGRLPAGAQWPRQRVIITAVDARTGEPVMFDRDSGIDLVDAVAASCAGGFAFQIGGEAFIDGGYRRNADNADLAAGYARVLALSPLGGRSLTPLEWGTHLAAQIAELDASGSVVATVFPDEDARAAFGENMMNPSTRIPAARAGYAQGVARARELSQFWRG